MLLKYYARFSHGPSSDPGFFPIAVWLQSPSNARAYADIGINTFVGLYQGPTEVAAGGARRRRRCPRSATRPGSTPATSTT